MIIYSCVIILIFFYRALYYVLQAYGMVGAGLLSVRNLVYGAVILLATIGGVVVFTLGGAGPPKLCEGGFCTTPGGAPCFFSQD